MKRLISLVLLFLFVFLAIWWFISGVYTTAFDVNKTVQVGITGEAYQNGSRVGLLALGTYQELSLPLVTPETSTQPVTTNFTITFAQPIPSTVETHFVSIESTSNMATVWVNPQRLLVSLYGVSPESYTQLVIQVPNGTFTPTLVNRFYNFLLLIPLINWFLLGSILMVGMAAFCLWRIRSERWPSVNRESATPPQGVTLLDMAVLHHGSITATDIVALLYDLANRGYVQLVAHFDEEVSFLRTTKQDGLTSGERNFLLVLFPQENSHTQLNHIIHTLDHELFSAVVGQLYIDLYNTFTERKYFRENPRQLHIHYKTLAIIFQLAGIGILIMGAFFFFHTLPGLIFVGLGLYLAGVIFFSFTYRFRPFSALGKQIVHECACFRAYLTNSKPIEYEGTAGFLFYENLAFATTLHCLKPWHERFSTSRMYIPDWYFNQEEATLVSDAFIEETKMHAEYLAGAMVAVKDPNVD